MSLFGRKRKSSESDRPNEINQLIQSILGKVGHQLAAFLSRKEQQLSVRSKKIAVVLFCLIMSTLSLTFLYRGLFVWNSRPPSYLSKPELVVPVIPHLPDSLLIGQPKHPITPHPSSPLSLDSLHP